MADLKPLSIAICTYNRCEQLRYSLLQLAGLSDCLVAGDEIIVVDNNSSDATRTVVSDLEASLPVIYLFESTQGLAAARNAALRNYRNDYLLFIDDDISVTREAITTYRQAFRDFPQDNFFGGRIAVDWQGRRPTWLKSDSMPLLSGLIGHYQLPDNVASYTNGALLPYGANFAVSRPLVDKVGDFDTTLGVSGEAIGRGEETDYLYRAMQLGFSGRYLDAALVRHRFQIERLSTRYLYRYGIEKGSAKIRARSYSRAVLFALKAAVQLARGRPDRYYQSVINIGIEMAQGTS